jgi:hypothetical protein
VIAELLAEGMGESLELVACPGAARIGAHSRVAAKKSFLRLSIDEVLLAFSIRRAAGQVGAVHLTFRTHPGIGAHSGNCVREILKFCEFFTSVPLPKAFKQLTLAPVSSSGHVTSGFLGPNLNLF